MSSNIQLLQVNLGENALVDAIEPQGQIQGDVLVVDVEGADCKIFLELLPELAQFLLAQIVNGLQHFGDHLELNFFHAHLSHHLLQVIHLPAMRDQSDVSAVLKLRVHIEELVGDFLLFQLLMELLKELLLLWEDTDQRLVLIFQIFAELFFLVLKPELVFISFGVAVEKGILHSLSRAFLFLSLILETPCNVCLVAASEEYAVSISTPNYLQSALFVEFAGFLPQYLLLLPQLYGKIFVICSFRVDFDPQHKQILHIGWAEGICPYLQEPLFNDESSLVVIEPCPHFFQHLLPLCLIECHPLYSVSVFVYSPDQDPSACIPQGADPPHQLVLVCASVLSNHHHLGIGIVDVRSLPVVIEEFGFLQVSTVRQFDVLLRHLQHKIIEFFGAQFSLPFFFLLTVFVCLVLPPVDIPYERVQFYCLYFCFYLCCNKRKKIFFI